jgi:hypothetical protein
MQASGEIVRLALFGVGASALAIVPAALEATRADAIVPAAAGASTPRTQPPGTQPPGTQQIAPERRAAVAALVPAKAVATATGASPATASVAAATHARTAGVVFASAAPQSLYTSSIELRG